MFSKTHYTEEELRQVAFVRKRLDVLRAYANAYDNSAHFDEGELQSVVDDILEEVAPLAERLGLHAEQKEMQDTCARIACNSFFKCA